MSVTVSEKYAEVLYEWSTEKDIVDETEETLQWLEHLLQKCEDFRFVWLHPVLGAEVKADIIEPAIRDEIPEQLWGFVTLLMQKRREDLLTGISEKFQEMVLSARGVKQAEVHTADELDSDMKGRLREVLSDRQATDIVLREHLDPDLMGGLVVRIDDLRIDGSLRNRLQKMERLLASNSNQQALTGRDE